MRSKVTGIDGPDGHEVKRFYEASSEGAAAALASADGLSVAAVEVVAHAAAEEGRAGASTPTIAYRSIGGTGPDYKSLRTASTALRVFAGICYVLGGLLLLPALFGIAAGLFDARVAGWMFPARFVSAAMPAISLCFIAVLCQAFSAACVALRDIARNSWR